MQKCTKICVYSVFLMLLLFVLASCGSLQKVGTIPRGTPDIGNGTPAVLPTISATLPSVGSAPTSETGSTYAFVRNQQLMLALQNKSVRQITDFNYTDLPNVSWQTPLWSPGDHFLAFIMSARKSGMGGGGCPGPDDSVGGLYVLNVQTNQMVQITLAQIQAPIQVNMQNMQPHSDNWQYANWEDATHLLAWYNGDGGNTGNAPGFYRYDLNTHTIALVIPLHMIGAQSDADVKQGIPFVLSVRYRSGQLFYEAVTYPYEQQGRIAIYARSVTKPEQQSTKLFDVGPEVWCSMQADSPYIFPGWDVSPDGEQVVVQTMLGSVQVMHVTDHSTTGLFSDVPTSVLSHDVQVTWAPDNQTVVLSQSSAQAEDGLYAASLADPVLTQHYMPSLTGQVTWRSDSTAFVLQSGQNTQPEGGNRSQPQNVYIFAKGDTHGLLLVANACDFTWG